MSNAPAWHAEKHTAYMGACGTFMTENSNEIGPMHDCECIGSYYSPT